MSAKFPRIPHLPWSPGGTRDDRRLKDVDHLRSRPVVVTEKLDGSNLCLTYESVFARSHSGAPKHSSFDAAKALHAQVSPCIPEYLSLFGEWCYAVHSIRYSKLPHYFHLFGVRDDVAKVWLSWEEVETWAYEIGVPTVPRITNTHSAHLLEKNAGFLDAGSAYGKEIEGYVVRLEGPYADEVFEQFTAKWVRKDHVQTDEHWSHREVERQCLSSK